MASTYYRVIAEVDEHGHFHFTKTNANSGNNGRAAIFNDRHGGKVFYTAGNAGNGSKTQPDGVIAGTGSQIMTEADLPLAGQPDPAQPTPVGSFNVTELGLPIDKIGKDTNFRGLTVFNNVIYTTKGSGGNGVNTSASEALRGVSFTPGTGLGHDEEADGRGSCNHDHRDDDCRDAD